jgi:hypothetical protein
MVKLLDSVGKGGETDGFDEEEPEGGVRKGKGKAKVKVVEESEEEEEEDEFEDEEKEGMSDVEADEDRVVPILSVAPNTPTKKPSATTLASPLAKAPTTPSSAPNTPSKSRKKDLPATYQPDVRSLGWLKVKKDYIEGADGGLGDSLDLYVACSVFNQFLSFIEADLNPSSSSISVPIGAWHGTGRKAPWWSPILLACVRLLPPPPSFSLVPIILSLLPPAHRLTFL